MTGILIPRGRISIEISMSRDPGSFYRNRPGLFLWDGMFTEVVAEARPVLVGTAYELNINDLDKHADDGMIECVMPQDHLLDKSDACGIIAELIERQKNGKPGHLLFNNGDTNLFYLESCVARVDWHARDCTWSVGGWVRSNRVRIAGSRIFSLV